MYACICSRLKTSELCPYLPISTHSWVMEMVLVVMLMVEGESAPGRH